MQHFWIEIQLQRRAKFRRNLEIEQNSGVVRKLGRISPAFGQNSSVVPISGRIAAFGQKSDDARAEFWQRSGKIPPAVVEEFLPS
ncbi:hypothetical protein KFK09_010152 [Dendrobium nobile]|uniref:Uncharacterized protein n=1 Tax=Dendrobium nobile TaxID=94219 RepID=A0A8T3BLR6_DENNO|nr:hypothetical protein KFK09_010152 [Dendrobium nobile]